MSGELVMEPGPVTIAAGSSSDDIRSAATVTATGRAVTLDGARRAYLSRAEVTAEAAQPANKPAAAH
jgi:hypothetical protein